MLQGFNKRILKIVRKENNDHREISGGMVLL
jgi:hypothetical protein